MQERGGGSGCRGRGGAASSQFSIYGKLEQLAENPPQDSTGNNEYYLHTNFFLRRSRDETNGYFSTKENRSFFIREKIDVIFC